MPGPNLDAARSGACPAGTTAAAGGPRGASPSNTAPPNCKVVHYGIDSLYLSVPGTTSTEAATRLNEAQKAAQSDDPFEQARALFFLPNWPTPMSVSPYRAGRFAYRIYDGRFNVKVASPAAKTLPMLYAQCDSKHLLLYGAEEVVSQLRELAEAIGEVEGEFSVSRIDMCVDFTYSPGIHSWDSDALVGRARTINRYESGGRITGWAIGQGGVLSARIYDKTEEIKLSDKGYMKTFWHESGNWLPDERVYRLEFQLRAGVLRDLGVNKWASLSSSLGGVWHYLTTDWLRLTIPSEADSTKSRWPTHPLWGALAEQAWELKTPVRRAPKDQTSGPSTEWFARQAASCLSSYMAVHRRSDIEQSWQDILSEASRHYDGMAEMASGLTLGEVVLGRAREKARKYGQPFDETVEAARSDQDEAVAREYRKRTKK